MTDVTHKEPMKRTLAWLLDGIADAPEIPLTGISSDSRRLSRGNAFLAYQGASHHGLEFLDQAIEAGVAAVLWDSKPGVQPAARAGVTGVTMIPVAGLAERLGQIANRWFDAPSERMQVSGVTGTNGKTTVSYLIAQCMQLLDRKCAYSGTLGAGIASLDAQLGLTTPGCIDLHRSLAAFVAADAAYAALEVSSHALDQGRVDGVRFDSVLFTNLSRDHIDYHGDMKTYGEVKARFVLDPAVGHRIINVDSQYGQQLAARCSGNVISVSTRDRSDAEADLHLRAMEADECGTAVAVCGNWGAGRFYLPLAGDFNVANAALVMAQLLCWKIPLDDAMSALGKVQPPPGRMQRVRAQIAQPAPVVYVDYAHTPAGLEAVLSTLRNHCKGELWCVFGCGGDRDRGKRRAMGETVARLADRAVVTSDNPRSEPPADIITAVLQGMAAGTCAIEDRAAAIAYAISNAKDDDVVLVAGKGHEEFQVIGENRRPFSDYSVALQNLEARDAAGGQPL